MSNKCFWLLIASLFFAIAGKSYLSGDQFVLLLTIGCSVCAIMHGLTAKPEQITLRKLIQLVQPK